MIIIQIRFEYKEIIYLETNYHNLNNFIHIFLK